MSGSAILTNTGLLKIASASPLDQLTITDIAVGDGVNPLSPTATGLVNEVYRDTASTPIRSNLYPDTLVFELNVPPTTGGFTVREIGAFDSEGDLIAVGTLDAVTKPTDGINLTVRINVKLANAAQVDVFYDNQGAIDFEGLRNRNASALNTSNGSNVQDFIDVQNGVLSPNINKSFTSKAIKNTSFFYWGGTGVNIIGDSISHGAFSRNIFENNWTNIFKRCFNAEYESDNYGFVNLWDQLGIGDLASQEIHQVSISNFTFRSQDDGSLAISGSEYESNSGDGSSIVTIDVPSFLPKFGVWYRRVDGGGTFDIEVNGAVIATVNTDASGGAEGGYFLTRGHVISDNGKGLCNIRLIAKTTAKVYLMGMSYESDSENPSVNNLSTSGRRLAKASRDVISKSVAGCQTLIMALGHNDAGDAENDDLYYNQFKQRIDWLISDCNTFGVPVIVPDFNWTLPSSYRVRVELKRLAESVDSGVYISFPELFKADSSIPDQNYIINTAELFDDASHPNIEGHKIIGETIAKVMCLSCTSKKESLLYHDWWRVFKIPDATPIKNNITDSRYSFAYKRNGNSLVVRGFFSNTDTPPPAQMPAGEFDVTEGETGLYFLNNDVKAFKTSPFTLDTYAFLQTVSATGNIKLHVKGSSGLSTANAAIVLSDY